MSELSIDRLESKITFLERHVEQQDRVILELRNLLDNTRKQIDALKEAMDDVETPQTDTIDEKPPHYWADSRIKWTSIISKPKTSRIRSELPS